MKPFFQKSFFLFVLLFCSFAILSCYKPKPVKVLKATDRIKIKTLFIALDGVDFQLMQELKKEGYFKGFFEPGPLISTFPTGTTMGFTGLFQSLNVGRVPGYEARFYSFKDNKIKGGTPWDIHKIDINYKTYFNYFRHKVFEKSVMYAFPGVAGKQDILKIEKLLLTSPKNLLFAYLGGTDGAAHMLGRERTKRFLKFMDGYLQRMIRRFEKKNGYIPRIVMFSDHGFHYDDLKLVDTKDFEKKLKNFDMSLTSEITNERQVVPVKYGLLSAGLFFTPRIYRGHTARILSTVKGVDLVFWHYDEPIIYIKNSLGEEARFEYKDGLKEMRYIPINGDPLKYLSVLKSHGYKKIEKWISADDWLAMTYNHEYPDVGYRLYDAFFGLVENPASILFSTKPNYHYGSPVTLLATYTKFGQKGTHGGVFKETTHAFFMTNRSGLPIQPQYLRYDQFFKHFIPEITDKYETMNKNTPDLFTFPQFQCCQN